MVLRRIVRFIQYLYFSLPVQMLVSQLGSHRGVLAFWLFIYLLVTDNLLNSFGGPNLFLEPEYQHKFSGTSMFLLGLAFGLFVLAYQLTCFILDGYRFLFLSYLKRPFRAFALNNFILPMGFVVIYIVGFVSFQRGNADMSGWLLTWLLFCLFWGMSLVLLVSTFYFWSLSQLIPRRLTDKLWATLNTPRRLVRRVRLAEERGARVEWFFNVHFRRQRAVNTFKGDLKLVRAVLNRNHSNALYLMLSFLGGLLLMGLLQHKQWLQLPAASSILILLSLLIMIVGGVTYWFRRLGLLILIVFGAGLFLYNRLSPNYKGHQALGLDYSGAPAEYTLANLTALTNDGLYRQDTATGHRMLDTWLRNYRQVHGDSAKPRLLMLCTSGGGLRAATWTVTCLQALDSITNGRLNDNLRCISGASGGMLGAAYWRELHYQQIVENTPMPSNEVVRARISQDLLNQVFFFSAANVLIPYGDVRYDGKDYPLDRGYAFEQQFIRNTQAFENRKLGHYYGAVADAKIPAMIFSPSVVNDGRQLIASELPMSYMAHAATFNAFYRNEVPAVEMRRLLDWHGADSLRFTSLMRMNASFPYILPFAELPTEPRVEVSDAGVIDNFGVTTSIRFLYTFRDWIKQNTAGVVLLQVRDTRREQRNLGFEERGLLARILSVFGDTYNSLAEAKDFTNDDLMLHASTWLGAPMDVIDLQYIPDKAFLGATLNFHLTRREKQDITQAITNPENVGALQYLQHLLAPDTTTVAGVK